MDARDVGPSSNLAGDRDALERLIRHRRCDGMLRVTSPSTPWSFSQPPGRGASRWRYCNSRTTRNPLAEYLTSVSYRKRAVERTYFPWLSNAPPRSTRKRHCPASHADPSFGAPRKLSFQQSSTHSAALPELS